jgi:hypothetical protein
MDTQTIDIAKLTPEQVLALSRAIKAKSKARSGDPKARATVIDAMLQEREGDGFKHTTADILSALQSKAIVSSALTADERAVEIKKIQTRKQLLVGKGTTDAEVAALKLKYGYKVSANGFMITADRIVAWLTDATPADKAIIRKALK